MCVVGGALMSEAVEGCCPPTVGGICSFCSSEYQEIHGYTLGTGSSDDHIRKLRCRLSPTTLQGGEFLQQNSGFFAEETTATKIIKF